MSDLAPLPGETVRLYVRLEGLASLRGAEALVLWTPHGADADGYRLVGFGAPAGTDCGWLFRGQLGDLNQVTDSTAHLSTAALATNTACAAGNAFYLDFAPPPSGLVLPARFALAFAKLADEGAASDVPLLGPAATILSGAVEPAPVVRTQFPSTGWVGQAVSYYLTGFHFLEGVQVSLHKQGIAPKPGVVSGADRHHLFAEFVFTEADTGRWDLVVANAGGRETRRERSLLVVKLVAPGPDVDLQGPDPLATMCVAAGAMPLTGPTEVPLVNLSGADPDLIADLEAAGVRTVRCLWPELTPQPTEAIQPDGSVEPLFDFGNCFVLRFDSIEDVDRALETLSQNPLVALIDPNQGVGPCLLSQFCEWDPPATCSSISDPDDWNFLQTDEFCGQWYLLHTESQVDVGGPGCAPGNVNEDIQSGCAWRTPEARGNSTVIIGVIDSGVDVTHPDLAYTYAPDFPIGERILDGKNFLPDRAPDDVTDDWGHGTNVAGLAAARTGTGASVTDPNRGIAGVAGGWAQTSGDSAGSRILPVRVAAAGNGDIDEASLPAAVNWAAHYGARVINLSLHCGVTGPVESVFLMLRQALANAAKLGVVTVVSMGNGGETQPPQYPARFAEWGLCVAVGASGFCGEWDSRSNTGPHIDLVAPGVKILTTHPVAGADLDGGVARAYREDGFGTSWSTALVTGVAASLKGMVPELRDVDIKEVLRRTAAQLDPKEEVPSRRVGWGRVDHAAAVRFLDPGPFTRRRLISEMLSSPTLVNPTPMTLTVRQAEDADIPDDTYNVMRWEARFPATFGLEFLDGPGDQLAAWVRVVGTKGWSQDNPHLFNYGWGEVLPATLTGTGATFRTYLYQVENDGPWFPVSPEQATLRYVVVGTVPGVTDAPMPQPGGRLSIRLGTNPAMVNSGVRLHIEGVGNKALEVSIHDVSGRRVVKLVPAPSQEGRWTLHWDGTGSDGRRIKPGVYFVRARQGDDRYTAKAVVLR